MQDYDEDEKKEQSEEENREKAFDIFNEFENSVRFKASEKLEEKCKRNERFYAGDHWKGVISNGLPLIVYNFLKQIVLAKVAIVASNELTMNFSPDDTSSGDKEVERAGAILTAECKRHWKRLKMDYENQITLIDSAITGVGATYWYWDEKVESGNKMKSKGDFKFEHLDVSELHFCNPRECDLQRQDYIIISKRKSLKKAKELAKNYGVSKENIRKIKCDEDQNDNYFDKKEDTVYDGNNVTILYKLFKEDGTVRLSVSTAEIMFTSEPFDTGFSIYPISMMNWDTRKRFIFGEAEITYMIPNQIAVNKLASLRHANALLFGSPKIIINESVIQKFSNQVGGVLKTTGSVRDAYAYIQPESMGSDVDKSIAENISLTKETASINDNLLGASRPENTSAIMLQQKQATIPLDLTKMRFYDYLEQTGRIWREFIVNMYDFERKVMLNKESGEMASYTGTEFKDTVLELSIDIGASTQWSEVLSVNAIDKFMERGQITPVQGISRYPSNIIPRQKELVDELMAQQQMQSQQPPVDGQSQQAPIAPPVKPELVQEPTPEAMEFTVDEMIEFLKTLPVDIQKAIGSIPEEDRVKMIQEMMVMSPDELKSVFNQIRS